MAIKSVTRFGIQRKIVANMTTESWQNIPHVSYQYEPDVTKFVEEFKKFTASFATPTTRSETAKTSNTRTITK